MLPKLTPIHKPHILRHKLKIRMVEQKCVATNVTTREANFEFCCKDRTITGNIFNRRMGYVGVEKHARLTRVSYIRLTAGS